MKSSRLLLLLLPLVWLVGCSSGNTMSGSGTMRIRMTDKPGPGNVEAVNLVVTEVSVRAEEGTVTESDSDTVAITDTGGWQVLSTTTKTYDLLTLQNGVFTTIGEGTLPAGTYTQIRLKLGAGSTIVVDGTTYPLKVPSGMQSGLKLNGTFVVPAGGNTDVGLDFDASRSIHETGNGKWMLKPVIRVIPISAPPAAGAIHGTVQPAGVATGIFAIQAPDTVASGSAGADGQFTISVLPPGGYSVAFHPASGFRDTTLTNVMVTAGTTTELDTVRLTPDTTGQVRTFKVSSR
ncbi:MAG TPA: DUF4382 domain-containing protein [Candidatus Eisenbacteria bacterium]|nr:DUF4382 domain-containing protein [Candidatus Eisenbacteria bacterium]